MAATRRTMQRRYNTKYKARLAKRGAPTREDFARVALLNVIDQMAESEKVRKSGQRFIDNVVNELVHQGFNRDESVVRMEQMILRRRAEIEEERNEMPWDPEPENTVETHSYA